MYQLIRKLNVITPICAILLGKDHNPVARLTLGVVTMAVGIFTYRFGEGFSHGVSFALDAVGFLIHGIGLTPWIELLAEKVE